MSTQATPEEIAFVVADAQTWPDAYVARRVVLHLAGEVAALTKERDEARAIVEEWETFRSGFDSLSYHHAGMGCGIEDRGITDRYAACEHGWDCAMERVAEWIPEETTTTEGAEP